MKGNAKEMKTLRKSIQLYHVGIRQSNENKAQNFFKQLRADCFQLYLGKMQNIFDDVKTYLEEDALIKMHNTAKDEALALVCDIRFYLLLLLSKDAV